MPVIIARAEVFEDFRESDFLHRDLVQHPLVCRPIEKEIHYFDTSYGRGEAWYNAHFPSLSETAATPGAITLDASPYYLFHPDVAGRLKAYAPDARIIILLREPVGRAWSGPRQLSFPAIE